VNSNNFLKVLTGDAKGMMGIGSGRVIKRLEFVCLFAFWLASLIVTITFSKCRFDSFALWREVIFTLTEQIKLCMWEVLA
jgi:hypothetical protein